MAKSKGFFRIENHPILFGMDIRSHSSLFIGLLLILTGILAPVGAIIYFMGVYHRTKHTSTSPARKKTTKKKKK